MIDTHAHLTDSTFRTDLSEVLANAFDTGVTSIITVATHLDDARKCIELSNNRKHIFPTVGIHAHEAAIWDTQSRETLYQLAVDCVAIGEIGLDYYYTFSSHDVQKSVFSEQLEIAVELGKPVIIHCRDAFADLKKILESSCFKTDLRGVIHCYTGNLEDARSFINRGLFLSFGGLLTFKNAEEIREVARSIPIDRIMLETDSPYLAPAPLRGKRNVPANIRYIYEKLAEIRMVDEKSLITIMNKNVTECFGINVPDQ